MFGFAARVAGGNIRAAKVVGLSVGKLILIICFLAGAAAGLAGMVEVAAVQGRTNANLAAGYGFAGILVAFLARQNPLAVIPVAILLGGIGASGGLLQRRLGLPDASVLVLQGMIFVMVLASDALYGRISFLKGKVLTVAGTATSDCGPCRSRCSAAPIRVSTPFLFVSLGECITERSGRINLGLEGTLVMGAMSGYGVSYLTGSPWLGVLAAGVAGAGMGALHAGDLRAAAGQRHRGRHRLDAVRRRACVLSRQAADRADRAAAAVDRFRLVERHSAGARGAAHQCACS